MRNNLMTNRSIASVFLAIGIVALSAAKHGFCASAQQENSAPDLRQALQKLAEFSPDPCGPPYGQETNWHSADVESRVFEQAVGVVTQELNAAPGGAGPPSDRAVDALRKIKGMSAEVNSAWPEENRFNFDVLDLPPALVVKMIIRAHERFFVFGVPAEDSGKPNRLWRRVGEDGESVEPEVPQSHLTLYPLHRSASGNTRFLASFIHSGCAGSLGVIYDAREWNPKGTGDLEQIVKQEGSFGLDDKVPGFPVIGKVRTEGAIITLPYCWFSAVDTWDNPSLCAVDTYDLSGVNVRFVSRAYNRPDLVPIAKTIEYAAQRDYPAALGYCDTQVARRLVRDVPTQGFFADDLRVTPLGKGREQVEMGYDPTYRFEVEKRAGRWLVVGVRTQ
ncbi:MAG: hypothetical protein ABSF28_06230 [Terracidiphilus sp.]